MLDIFLSKKVGKKFKLVIGISSAPTIDVLVPGVSARLGAMVLSRPAVRFLKNACDPTRTLKVRLRPVAKKGLLITDLNQL